jgi:tripartite motif-containing protein 71
MKVKFTVGLVFAGFFLATALAQDQSGQVKFIYGVGGYSDSQPFSHPQGIFCDRFSGEVYVCDSGNHQVVIFDSSGFPLYRFNHWLRRSGEEERILGEPRNLVVSRTGDIFLIDNLVEFVDILDQRGNPVDRLILQDIPEFENVKMRPEFLAVDDQDHLFVATSGDKVKILVFDADLHLLSQFGTKGEDQGELKTITGLWVDHSGKIYVTDADASWCVQVFSPQGEFLLGFGGHDIKKEDFSLPTGVVTTSDGKILVADELRQVVKVFDGQGAFLFWFGGFGVGAGAMRYPRCITGDGKEEIFVVERVGKRFQKFLLGED